MQLVGILCTRYPLGKKKWPEFLDNNKIAHKFRSFTFIYIIDSKLQTLYKICGENIHSNEPYLSFGYNIYCPSSTYEAVEVCQPRAYKIERSCGIAINSAR